MLDGHHRLPAEPGRIPDDVQFRRAGAVENCVEPEISFESFGRAVLIFAQRHDSNACPAFDFDEPDLDLPAGR